MRIIAVDWSGDSHTARNRIWLAEATPVDGLIRLECGRDRSELCAHLLSLPPDGLVIGLDFAFSFPEWFLTSLGISTAPQLWSDAAAHAEEWLRACEPPFWGRPGKPRPLQDGPALRLTDLAVPRTNGIGPKSIFQIGGAGAVGTGSVRGMPMLQALHARGARIWPFTDHGSPTVLEIYPRLFTGPVHKSNPVAREALLTARYPTLREDLRRSAIGSEDAFDAAVSALEMARHTDQMARLPTEKDVIMKLEGSIWHPRFHDDCR
jgi:hypothetical protein